jgi:hypothetical protein
MKLPRKLFIIATITAAIMLSGCAKIVSVTLPSQDGTVYTGDVLTVSPKITYNTDKPSDKDVAKLNADAKWTSSDLDIVTVDGNGVCVAKGAGTATITYTNGNTSATVDITVTAPVESINVSGVTLTNLNPTADASITVLPAEAADNHLTYSVDNTDVATVDDSGKLTFVGAGGTTLTVKADNGVVGSAYITAEEYPTIITASHTDVSLSEGDTYTDEVYNIDLTGTGLTGWDKSIICWSDDDSIATIDAGGDITGVKAGTTTVHVAVDPDHKVCADVAVTVKAWVADSSTKRGREEMSEKEAAEIVSQICTAGMTDYQKAEAIYNWFGANVATQDVQSNEAYKSNYGNEAYSAFFMGISACSGQCKACVMMCQDAGLQVRHVNEGLWSHQWCLVYLNGQWTVLDPQGRVFGGTKHPLEM